jgi:hypothetical protein
VFPEAKRYLLLSRSDMNVLQSTAYYVSISGQSKADSKEKMGARLFRALMALGGAPDAGGRDTLPILPSQKQKQKEESNRELLGSVSHEMRPDFAEHVE